MRRKWKIAFIFKKALEQSLLLIGISFLTACHSGGKVISAASNVIITQVQVPTIAAPATSPYFSKDSSLVITGMCGKDHIVRLKGDSIIDQTPCYQLTYSFIVNRSVDGFYAFVIDQVDSSSRVSDAVSLIWIRQTSISKPTILSPATSPFASAQTELTLTGSCQTGTTVSLSGDATNLQDCTNSQFSFSVPKAVDGDFTIEVKQTDLAGNSASSSVVWQKHAIKISPSNSTVVAGSAHSMNITGGSGSYTTQLQINNSGATFDEVNRTYTAGTLSGVSDTIRVIDSLGSSVSTTISTTAGAADHLVVIAGNNQSEVIGHDLTTTLKVRTVDRYGNGIPNYQLFFQVMAGDARITSSPTSTTNMSGDASITMKMGFSYNNNKILVRSFSGELPDLAVSGNSTLMLTENATTQAANQSTVGHLFSTVTSPGPLVMGHFGKLRLDNQHLDLAVLNTSGNNMSVLLNKGNGMYTTTSYTLPTGCTGPSAITTADFDGDSILDLVVLCISGKITIFQGKSDGSFESKTPFDTETSGVDLVAAVFKTSSKVDLAVATNTGIILHYGDGTGNFSSATSLSNFTGISPIALKATDFNRDGLFDLLVLNGNGVDKLSLLINKNDATGTFNSNVDFSTGNGAASLAIGDFDRNSFPDAVVTNTTDNSVSLFLNNQVGGMETRQDLVVGTGPSLVVTADLQSASYSQDLIILNAGEGTVGVLLNETTLSPTSLAFSDMSALSFNTPPSSFALGDTNGDGRPELVASVASNPSFIQVLSGLSGGEFGNFISVGTYPADLVVGNLVDNDTHLNAVVVNQSSNNISVLQQNDSGQLNLLTTLTAGINPSAVTLADINRDTKLDIVVANRGSNSMGVFINNGNGTFINQVSYSVSSSPAALVVNDLNHDGAPDVIVASSNSNRINVLMGRGDGTFQSKVDYIAGAGPSALTASDFNNDGFIDIVVTNSNDGTIAIFLGNGDGTLQTQITYSVGASPVAIVTGDFNGDGIMDLAVNNSDDLTVSILQGSGNGSFVYKQTINSGGSFLKKIITGVFNANGYLDLAVSNGDNTFSVLRNSGNGTFGVTPKIQTADDSTAEYNGIMAADLNKDGIVDLLLLDNSNNRIDTWVGQ